MSQTVLLPYYIVYFLIPETESKQVHFEDVKGHPL